MFYIQNHETKLKRKVVFLLQEFFFLPFSLNDVAKGEQIKKGDSVEFYVATNKKTGSMKARKIRYMDPGKQVKTVQGTYIIIHLFA